MNTVFPKRLLIVGLAVLALAGCTTKREIAGAGVGGVGGALVAGPVGAVVGAGAGVVVAHVTAPNRRHRRHHHHD